MAHTRKKSKLEWKPMPLYKFENENLKKEIKKRFKKEFGRKPTYNELDNILLSGKWESCPKGMIKVYRIGYHRRKEGKNWEYIKPSFYCTKGSGKYRKKVPKQTEKEEPIDFEEEFIELRPIPKGDGGFLFIPIHH